MHFTTLSLALALAAVPNTFAQTFSDCDPTKKTDCPTKAGLTSEYSVDFRTGAAALDQWTTTTGVINSVADGAEFKIEKLGDGPTIRSKFQIFFGYVEVVMKAAPGAGIVSSFVMESDDLDEIDWEWIGSDTSRAQSNYFGKGNTSTFDRGQFHPVATPETAFRTYAVNWTQETTTWLIDGAPVRTLNFADAVGGQNYPQTPMDVRFGNWVAGDPKNAPGTIEWAGGLTDFSQGPFSMVVQSVKVINYNPGASYQYSDQTGSWQSIVVDGKAATASADSVETGSTTGPGEVVSSPIASAAETASGSSETGSGSAASGGPLPVVTINLGGMNGGNAGAAVNGSTPCTSKGSLATAAAVSSGSGGIPATVSINLGSSRPTAGAASNSTGGNGGNGGIVAAGSPSNATLPTYTIKPGGAGSNGGNGAAATTGATTLATATQAAGGASNPAQTSFSLGAQTNGTSTSTGGPLKATTNAGSKLGVSGLGALLAVGLVLV